jgi:hypothetical protein
MGVDVGVGVGVGVGVRVGSAAGRVLTAADTIPIIAIAMISNTRNVFFIIK